MTAGGAGKTPVVLSLAALFRARGQQPHILSRGYGGSLKGPLRVDPARHTADEVGDEPLLLAAAAPTWIGADRVASAQAAIAAGADLLLLDDGFQNPALAYDVSLIVIDGGFGFGNGRVMPAGPLREPIARALERASAAVIVGASAHTVAFDHLPVLGARLVPLEADDLKAARVVAFAGIGRPAKFFATLRELGADPRRDARLCRSSCLQRNRSCGAGRNSPGQQRRARHHREGLGAAAACLAK